MNQRARAMTDWDAAATTYDEAPDHGLTSAQTLALAAEAGLKTRVRQLVEAACWGRAIDGERYLVSAHPTTVVVESS